MIQDMFITRQDIAYSNQPDYGQRQGLGAEKELKTSEERSDGAGREWGDGQAPEQTFKENKSKIGPIWCASSALLW